MVSSCLSLSLVIALIGAVLLFKDNEIAKESEDLSSAMIPLTKWSRNIIGFGPQWTYRTNTLQVKGFSKREVIGALFRHPGSGLKPLRVVTNPTDHSLRNFGIVAVGYTRRTGIAGYCSIDRRDGFAALVEVSKYNRNMNRRLYAYAYSQQSYATLKSYGYSYPRRLCYISISSLIPIIEWSKNVARFGLKFEYRVNGARVAGYNKGGVLGWISTRTNSNRRVLRVYSNPDSGSEKVKWTSSSNAPKYSRYKGIAGYCEKNQKPGTAGLKELRKYDTSFRSYEYAYATNNAKVNYLKRLGYSHPVLVCYIHVPPPPSSYTKRIYKFERIVGSNTLYEYSQSESSKPFGYVYKGVMPVTLSIQSSPGMKQVFVFCSRARYDSQLWVSGPLKPGYNLRRGSIGYCFMAPQPGFRPIWKLGRYTSNGAPRDNAYTVSAEQKSRLISEGFKDEGILCYARG